MGQRNFGHGANSVEKVPFSRRSSQQACVFDAFAYSPCPEKCRPPHVPLTKHPEPPVSQKNRWAHPTPSSRRTPSETQRFIYPVSPPYLYGVGTKLCRRKSTAVPTLQGLSALRCHPAAEHGMQLQRQMLTFVIRARCMRGDTDATNFSFVFAAGQRTVVGVVMKVL